jgi:hypothetical protein
VDFIVSVRVQATETIVSIGVGKTAAHTIGAKVFQKDDAIGEWIVRFIANHSVNGAQLGFLLGILGCGSKNKAE